MNLNILPSNRVTLAGVINPDANVAAAYSTGWINAATAYNFLALISAGEMAATSTLNAKLQQATDDSGTGVKDIALKSIVEMLAATDSDKQAMINLRSEELDTENDFTHFRLTVTIATAASDSSAVVLALDAHEQPMAQPATVFQIIE